MFSRVRQIVLLLILLLPLSAAALSYGPVEEGENLSAIASKILKHHQLADGLRPVLMVGIVAENPTAFKKICTIQSLKKGVVLQLPDLNRLKSVEVKVANDWVQRHVRGGGRAACDELARLWPSTVAAPPKEGGGATSPPLPEKSSATLPTPVGGWPDLLPFALNKRLIEQWRQQRHPDNSQWVAVKPAKVDPAAESYAVVVVISRESNDYRVGVEMLLEQLNRNRFAATLTLINVDGRAELMAAVLAMVSTQAIDLMVTVGAEATHYLHQHYHGPLPVVTMASPDPVLRGEVESYGGSKSHMAYTSMNLPMALQREYLHQLKPQLKVVGIIYDSTDEISVQGEVVPLSAELTGVKVAVVPIAIDWVPDAAAQLTDRIPLALVEMAKIDPSSEGSLLWVSSSPTVLNQLTTISQQSGKVPLVSANLTAVRSGESSAALAFGIDIRSNAQLAARLMMAILRGGVTPESLPVGVVTPADIAVNLQVARRLGLKVPVALLDIANFIYDIKGRLVRDFGRPVGGK